MVAFFHRNLVIETHAFGSVTIPVMTSEIAEMPMAHSGQSFAVIEKVHGYESVHL